MRPFPIACSRASRRGDKRASRGPVNCRKGDAIASTVSPCALAANGLPGPSALVVEDDGLIALAIVAALEDAGARYVASCDTTAAALLELERIRPDILILDVHLADSDDGWAIAELAMQLSVRPPLIVYSTASPERIPAAIARMGHVLPKPFVTVDLVRLVRAHLHKPGLLARLRQALPFLR